MQYPEREKIKILIVKLGAIGDVVMALPMVTAIREKYPDAEITWLCGKIAAPIPESVEAIDNVITVDDALLFKGSAAQKFMTVFSCLKALAFRRYDYIITPYRDRRYKILTFLTGRKIFRSFDGRDRLNSIIPGRYHSVEYVKLFTGQDDHTIKERPFPRAAVPESQMIKELLFDNNKPVIAIAPGGANNLLNKDSLRNWPAANYGRLAELLAGGKYNFALLGARTDEWTREYFKGLPVIDLIGKTSLLELIYILKNSALLITHDTGILHVGKLAGVKTLALFGPVNPCERVGKNERIEVIWEGSLLPCSPCYNGKIFAGCGNNLCMKNITVEAVYSKTLELLTNKEN